MCGIDGGMGRKRLHKKRLVAYVEKETFKKIKRVARKKKCTPGQVIDGIG